ncbi:MAG: AraC family transcriptional regulator [Candidatus Azobacteroides sp.]|nr:AraC family transcriptional regulator [Candidatus Azobacteroides sp.]
MIKKIQHTIPDILIRLSYLLGTELKGRKLVIPEQFGRGHCTGFVFNEQIRMIISDYELNEDIPVKNSDVLSARRMIVFKFRNIFPETRILESSKQPESIPSVLIATSHINTEEVISIHTNTSTINIEVDAEYLNGLFDLSEKSPVLESLLQNTQPLLFEQIIYPSLQKIVNEILTESVNETFQLFFLRVKAEELICRLLMELEKRDEKHLYALNSQDIQTIYQVKEHILAYPGSPPKIKDLATLAHMSPTKLKRLFKQIFGDSIFSYYQKFRMQEAARLLKEEKLSVSEVGYQLGFTNLSHFSRVFKEHLGMKPKQYSRT